MLIGQVTDIHLGFEPNNPAEFNRARLDRVIGRFRHGVNRPDLVLATGDLTDKGDVASYRHLREAFEGLDCPVLCALGNHDVRAHFLEVFPETPVADGFVQYVVERDGRRLIVIDTLEEGRHGGAFCETRAAWLAGRLGEAPDTPTVIVMHHPPVEVGIDWMNTDPQEPWVHRFSRAIAGHGQVQALLCGHLHRAISAPWQGVTVSICSSSAPQVALDLRPIDPETPDLRDMIVAEPPAYALHRWTETGFVSLFGAVGESTTLARYDAKMQTLVQSLMGERPGRG